MVSPTLEEEKSPHMWKAQRALSDWGDTDATNTTRARRNAIVERVKKEKGISLIFLESICTDPAVIEANVDVKVASGDPDYDGQPKENAKKDFLKRIAHYEANYETVNEPELSFCKVVNVGYEVTVNRIDKLRPFLYLSPLDARSNMFFFSSVIWLLGSRFI
jgi:6-phosphofructo-2-kinase/fructose-2,6-biphosphatase 2